MVYYSGGSMNAILLTMPAVVYVAGISGAIHFANYYRDSVAESGIEVRLRARLKHSWLPCTLSAGTTAAGLISLYTSELVPIKIVRRLFGRRRAGHAGLAVPVLALLDAVVADAAAQPAGWRPAQGRRHRPAGQLAAVSCKAC